VSTAIQVSAREGYALWAEEWDATPSPIVAVEERALLPWIARVSARRAIDVGCGTGRWTARIAAIGLDASVPMLAVAAGKPGLHGRLAACDAAALPLANASADLVLCALTLGHMRKATIAMREFERVLMPGGALLLTDFHPAASAHGWRRTFRRDEQVYELENYPYTVEQLCEAAPGLALAERIDASIGEPERELFDQAGRPGLFASARDVPAVLLTRWLRR
jgi:malonyl-CoA O-methyltransferase